MSHPCFACVIQVLVFDQFLSLYSKPWDNCLPQIHHEIMTFARSYMILFDIWKALNSSGLFPSIHLSNTQYTYWMSPSKCMIWYYCLSIQYILMTLRRGSLLIVITIPLSHLFSYTLNTNSSFNRRWYHWDSRAPPLNQCLNGDVALSSYW